VVHELYGDRLDNIILYGSYARDDFNKASDIDFLVILKDEKISTLREIDYLTDQVFDLILKFNIDISYLPVSRKRFQNGNVPLFYFVKKEGIEG